MISVSKKAVRLEWREMQADEWDRCLTSLQGHPLQSAAWGQGRSAVNGQKDFLWAAFENGKPVYLARIEERRILGLLKIAWIPKGPTILDGSDEAQCQAELFLKLKKRGFSLCVMHPWRRIELTKVTSLSCYTIWIDLSIGKENLWQSLSKQVRYEVRRASKLGVSVERTEVQEDIVTFHKLCKSISQIKRFQLNTSVELMLHLLTNKSNKRTIDFKLFVARSQDKVCGGALIARCGVSIHYIWGAVDREYAKLNIGEAIQWHVMQWAIDQKCTLYDLEGIDQKNNPGVYNFKKKLSKNIIALPGIKFYPLNIIFKILTPFMLAKNNVKLLYELIFKQVK